MSAQYLRVSTPQGEAGELSHEQSQYLFGYQTANPAAAISLSMPVRKAQYAHGALHPIFQMNLPEGFLLEELQNRLAKIVNLEPMMLLALSGGQSPVGRVTVQSDFVNPLASQQGKGERLSEILAWDGTENLFTELVDKYIYRTGISGVQPKVLVPQVMEPAPSKATVLTQDLIVKSGRQEYPGLAANEFLCMSIAKESGLVVPEFHLSKNKELFVIVEENKSATSVPIIVTIGNSPIGGRPANPHAAWVCVICAMNVTLPGGQKNLQNECATAAKSILEPVRCSAEEGSGDCCATLLG